MQTGDVMQTAKGSRIRGALISADTEIKTKLKENGSQDGSEKERKR